MAAGNVSRREIAPGVVEFRAEASSPGPLGVSPVMWLVTGLALGLTQAYTCYHCTLVACAAAAAVWFVARASAVAAEAVVVFKNVGLQLETHFQGGGRRERLVDIARVKAVIINEGVGSWEVKSYLAVVIDGESEMAPAFPTLRPRLPALVEAYRGINSLVFGWDVDGDGGAREPGT